MKKPAKSPKPTPFQPVTVAQQRAAHRKAVQAWKPVPVAAQRKQHQAAVAKGRKKVAKKRGLALAEGLSCCAAEAVAMSLRLAGQPVSDEQVVNLYLSTPGADESGASIPATLEAVSKHGLAAARSLDALTCDDLVSLCDNRKSVDWPTMMLLGVDLPGPHCVLATPDGWWSWGELYDPATWPDAIIEEAWAVTWQ